MKMDEPAVQDLRCPLCKGTVMVTLTSGGSRGTCRDCGEQGKVGYFQPDPEPIDTGEKFYDRYIDVEDENMAAAGELVAQTLVLFTEEARDAGVDLDWPSLKIVAAKDNQKQVTTFVVAVRGYKRPPASVSTADSAFSAILGAPVAQDQFRKLLGWKG